MILQKLSNDHNENSFVFHNNQSNELQNRNNLKYMNHFQKKGNIAAVEPFNHTPIKYGQNHIDYPLLRKQNEMALQNTFLPDSDENKLARKTKLQHELEKKDYQPYTNSKDYTELHVGRYDMQHENMPYNSNFVPKNGSSFGFDGSKKPLPSQKNEMALQKKINDGYSKTEKNGLNEKSEASQQNTAGHLFYQMSKLTQFESDNENTTFNFSVAQNDQNEEKINMKAKVIHVIPSGNLVAPPRKPISSVAPTSFKNTLKTNSNNSSPKVHVVTPNITNISSSISLKSENEKSRPALPPKPSRGYSMDDTEYSKMDTIEHNGSNVATTSVSTSDPLPIKAKPLTIKKQPITEQPKLRSTANIGKSQVARKVDINQIPTSLDSKENSNKVIKSQMIECLDDEHDETDKCAHIANKEIERKDSEDHLRRKRIINNENMKIKLARRVSFDPLGKNHLYYSVHI